MQVTEGLKALGVGYRNSYGGAFESNYPHERFHFKIVPDRDGTAIQMCDDAGGGEWETIGFAQSQSDLAEEIVLALEDALLHIKSLSPKN